MQARACQPMNRTSAMNEPPRVAQGRYSGPVGNLSDA